MDFHMEAALATIRVLAAHIEATGKLLALHGVKAGEEDRESLVNTARRLADKIEANYGPPAPRSWRWFGWLRRKSS